MTTRLLPAILYDVLDNLKNDYKQRSSIEELLLSLNSIFGPVLTERALELIDDESVFLIQSQERYIFQVVGSRGDIYTIMEVSNFCTCDFFKHQVLKDRALCCKHFLAAKVAFILGNFKTKSETPGSVTSILLCAYGNQEIK
ncbi:Zinc finger, SWIM-type [Cinara cedri]|uniref:Zinc finger, SWIM-type n=1 Tax=Cinara cedri TaxID=506608 RepID=A0A5E4NA99_9HEMI|nr:Zinc finger, SWIM-type [Cinara cedri]